MEIISAEFVISNSDYTKCPNSQLLEYAFIDARTLANHR